jgi:amino acid transporter
VDQPIAHHVADTDEGLVRVIGLRALTANFVNATVGSGIFVLPAVIAATLGPASVLGYLVCALGVGLLSLCYAELGSRVARSGGTFAYIETAFGPFAGVLAGVLLWFGGDVVSCAAIAVVVVETALAALGLEVNGWVHGILLVALIASLAMVNVRGVRTGARLVEVVTVAKLAPLLFLIVVGLFRSTPSNLVWTGLPAAKDVARATFILTFAFTGAETVLNTSGEVRDPIRTIPRAIFSGLFIVAALYIGVHLAAQGILGPLLASEQQAPLAAAAGRASGAAGRQFILAGTLISAFGFLAGNILAAPRMLFAFARDGIVPRQFAAVHPRYRTPYVAIGTHAILACGFALTGSFRALAVLTVLPTLLVLLGCCLATLVLRRRDVRTNGEPFRIPAGPVVPLIGTCFVLWLMSSAARAEVLVVAAMLMIATAVYALRRWRIAGRASFVSDRR